MKKRFDWFEILLILAVMGVSVYAAFSDSQNLAMRWFIRDDAYYYFKVAQNISEGLGSTFDGVNPTNGYHPLWMLICIPIFALARFDLILPLRILLIVLGAFSAGTGVMFYRLLGRVFHPVVGALAAVYWVFNYDILQRVYQMGLETGLAVLCVVWLAYKLYEFETNWRTGLTTQRQLMGLGFAALLAAFSRLDLVFLAGMVGLWILFRRYPLRYLLPLDLVALPVSVLLAFILRIGMRDYLEFSSAALTMAAVAVAVKLPLAYFLGLYQPDVLRRPLVLARQLGLFLISGSALTGMLMLIIARLEHFDAYPRITIVYDLALTAAYFVLSRFGAYGLRTSDPTTAANETPLTTLQNNGRQWLNEGLAYFGVVGAGMAVYMLSNKLLFGNFSPVSGQIKRWWGSLPGKVYDGPVKEPLGFFGLHYTGDSNTWHPVSTWLGSVAEQWALPPTSDETRYLILLAITIVLLYGFLYFNKSKAKTAVVQLSIIPLFASTGLQILYYHAPGYAAYKEWYWTTQLVLIVLVVSFIPGLLFRLVRRFPYATTAGWVLVAAFAWTMFNPFWFAVSDNMTYGEWDKSIPNNDIAAFLEAHTEPGSLIGLTGGGNAGYFVHDRTVVNMDGLINSQAYFDLLQQGQAGDYLAAEGMDYILANNEILNQLPYRGQFAPYIEWMDIRYGGKDLMRYHSTPFSP